MYPRVQQCTEVAQRVNSEENERKKESEEHKFEDLATQDFPSTPTGGTERATGRPATV